MPSVVLGLPLLRGQLEPECLHSLMAAREELYRRIIHHKLLTNECSLISASRNGICEMFLNNTDGDYLMWIDSDIQFPPYGIPRLLGREKDIIGGIYYNKTVQANPTLLKLNENNLFQAYMDFPLDRPFEVDGIGTGFLLIKREVLEKFTPEVMKSLGTPFGIGLSPDENGRQEGEDLSFCRRAKALGYKIWADPTIPLGHIGKVAYTRQNFINSKYFQEWQAKKATYTNDIPGWMTPTELNWLHNTAKGMDSIIEIGSWMGRSTHALLSGCKGKVIAVDTFEGTKGEERMHEIAKEHDITQDFFSNVGQFDNLETWKMTSLEAAELVPDQSVDMVFLDGDHSYASVKADIEAWLPKARKLLCGHDWSWFSVQEAVSEKFGEPDTADTIWLRRLG